MNVSSGSIYLSVLLFATIGSAADLKQSRFNQIVNDVKVLEMASKQTKKASVNEMFNLPDVIRTGPGSRAELIAEDKTITRIGANSIFSFNPENRTISLEKGSLLFQAPKGKGGGKIRTTSAAASVLGTTMVVAATDDGGFKVLLLEGSGKVTLPNGKSATLKAGQMLFVLPNEGGFSPIVTFRLAEQVEGSLLVNGFDSELPSMELINLEITRQNKLIANGQAIDTGYLVGDNATPTGVDVIDPVLLQQLFVEEERGHVDPPPGPGPVDPPPLFFDLIIGSAILDDEDLQIQPDFGYFMEGNNVLVDAETVNMDVASEYSNFSINANNVMQFADNLSHSTAFQGAGFQSGTQFLAAAESSVYALYLTARDFIFPNDFTLTFDGYQLQLLDLHDDMNLSSTSEKGLRIRTLASEGNLELWADRDMNLTGNVRLYGDGLYLSAGNSLNMNGGYLGFRFFADVEADNRLTMRNVGFGGGGSSINLAAKTVVLENITFPTGSTVTLRSELGQLAANPNTRAAIEPGKVNFYDKVFYGSSATPAQNVIGQNIFIPPLNPAVRP